MRVWVVDDGTKTQTGRLGACTVPKVRPGSCLWSVELPLYIEMPLACVKLVAHPVLHCRLCLLLSLG